MTTYGISDDGFEAKPLAVIETELDTELRAGVSTTLNLSETSLLGQFKFAVARQLRQVWEAFQVEYSQRDPSQATGESQNTIGEIRGIPRLPAAPSSAAMTISLAAGTYAVGSLVVQKTADSDVKFANANEITTVGATLTDQPFLCTSNGPISAPAGTLVTIANPIAGFTAPSNPADAVLGRFEETDDEYRLRQQETQQIEGSSTVNAIRSDLLDPNKVPGVTYAQVLENDTDAPVVHGSLTLPPHSVAPIVDGTFDAEVLARQIFLSKAGGIQSYGTTTEPVVTSSGQTVTIGYTAATLVPVDMAVYLYYLTSAYADAAAVTAAAKDAILAAFAAYQNVGFDVAPRRYSAAVFGLAGIVNVLVLARRDADAFAETDVVVDAVERATLIAGDITVFVTPLSAQP